MVRFDILLFTAAVAQSTVGVSARGFDHGRGIPDPFGLPFGGGQNDEEGVLEYSTVISQVFDGVNDIKEMLSVDKTVPAEQASLKDEVNKLSMRSSVLQRLVDELLKSPEGQDAPAGLKMALESLTSELNATQTWAEQAQKVAAINGNHQNTRPLLSGSRSRRLLNEMGKPVVLSDHVHKVNYAHRKYGDDPKVRHHMGIHEKLAKGDISFVDHLMDRITPAKASAHLARDRRLQEMPILESCNRMVTCLEGYTLYDFVAYYYGVYANDEGKIDSEKLAEQEFYDFPNKIKMIWEKLDAVRTKINTHTCKALLREFHRNEKRSVYNETKVEEYFGSTWRDVCRAEGTTQYIQLNEIRDKVDAKIAYHLVDDMANCADNIGDDTMFDVRDRPRVATAMSSPTNKEVFDDYGQPLYPVPTREWHQFDYLAIMDFDRKWEGFSEWDDKPSMSILEGQNIECPRKVDQYYRQWLKDHPFSIITPKEGEDSNFAYGLRQYPDINYDCDHAGGKNWDCWIKAGDQDICGKFTLTGDEHPSTLRGGDGLFKKEIYAMFEGDKYDIDKMLGLILGKKISIGLVCAYAEAKKDLPGYCCMDQPWERPGDKFGTQFTCKETKSECTKTGPGLSGFSEESCKLYSGTWCPNPTDCSTLQTCINEEKTWANENKKHTYLSYLTDAPELTDTTSVAECGAYKEYFGFDQYYPVDVEICEDVALLRYNQNFDNLDKGFVDGDAKITAKPVAMDELTEPITPTPDFDYYNDQVVAMFRLEMAMYVVEKVYDMVDAINCPEGACIPFTCIDPVKTVCTIIKNIALVITYLAVQAMDRTMAVLDFNYGQAQISDFQMYEIYNNVDAVYGNMETMNKNLGTLNKKLDAMATSRRKLGTTLLGADFDAFGSESPEVFVPPCLGWKKDKESGQITVPGKSFKSTDEAISFLRDSLDVLDHGPQLDVTVSKTMDCSTEFEVLPTHVIDDSDVIGQAKHFVLGMDTAPPSVACGFLSKSAVTKDGKTLIVPEGTNLGELLDSTFFYSAEDQCSDGVSINVVVESSEFDEQRSILIAKTMNNQAEIFVAPTMCKSQKRDSNKSFCHSNPSIKERIYKIQVTATDDAGLKEVDTCRIVVTPEGVDLQQDSKSSKSVRGAGDDYVTTLIARAESIKTYEVGSLSISLH